MATPVLYVAQVPLWVRAQSASWPCPAGNVLPLDPSKASTMLLLGTGLIVPAPPGAADNTTPADLTAGTPGLHVAVSN
ncbi:MAG TPA: hypothetical protein VK586_02505 [Streptosporangiaceae bacterium]|nr:hypothetical protein [Streptosporangiaceae bacterium]